MNGTLAENLKKTRLKKGFTQKHIADILNISRSTYAAYEAGIRKPDIYKLLVMADAMGTTVEDLAGQAGADSAGSCKEGYKAEYPLYSLEDYFALKGYHDFELLEGELARHNTLTYSHQTVNRKITEAALARLKSKRGYEVISAQFYVVLDRRNTTIVQPDISIIHDTGYAKQGIYYGVPDLIIETVPEKNKHYDYCEKLYIYHKYGVKEFWIVDPGIKRTTVYNLENDTSPVVKSFTESVSSFAVKSLTLNMEEVLKEDHGPEEGKEKTEED